MKSRDGQIDGGCDLIYSMVTADALDGRAEEREGQVAAQLKQGGRLWVVPLRCEV